MTEQNRLMDQLTALDPVRTDPAPGQTSRRYAEIREHAMRDSASGALPSARPRRSVPWSLVAAGMAAAVLVAVAIAVAFARDATLSPAAALTRAAEQTRAEVTLRSEYVRDEGGHRLSVVRAEHRGSDVRRSHSVIEPDGTEHPDGEDDEFVVFIGDTGWKATDGPDEGTVVRPEERNAPYADASAAIIEAAVTESDVTDLGVDNVRGTDARHYRIAVNDGVIERLAALPPNVLSGFELEYPGHIRSLDIWVGDGYIRRVRVTQDWEASDSLGTVVEFYDFGADITIAPPG